MIVWLPGLLLFGSASAQEPVWQWVTRADGLDTNWVRDLHQGPDHRIVMGTSVGVFAWDGDRARRIDGGQIRAEILRVERFAGQLVARDVRGRVWVVDGDQTRPLRVAGEDLNVRDLVGSPTALTYVSTTGQLWELKPGQSPRPVVPTLTDVRGVWGAPDALIVAAKRGWFRVHQGAATSLQHRESWPEDALVDRNGTIWIGDDRGVWTLSETGPPTHRLPQRQTRIALAEADGAVWAAGAALTRFSDGEITQTWIEKDGYRPSGHALMIDHEGGLWAGGGRGVGYVAEPSLVRWAPKHGLADRAPRRMAWHPDALWISHWNGLSLIADGAVSVDPRGQSPGEPCVDAEGEVWFLDYGPGEERAPVLRTLGATGEKTWPVTSLRHFFEGCHGEPEGSAWLTAGDRLLRARGGTWEDIGPLPQPRARDVLRSLHVQDGVAVYTKDRFFCQVSLDTLAAPEDWTCVEVDGQQPIMAVSIDEYGQYWLVGTDDTVLVGGLDGWRSPTSASTLPGTYLVIIEPSPRGGMWIGGEGPIMRVEMRPGTSDWRVLETIDGLVDDTLSIPVDLVETPSGTIYVTVRVGVIELSAEARDRTLPPPEVSLVEVIADGEALPIPPDAAVHLAHPSARLQLRVAVYSYRSRRDLLVRTRLDDGPWSAPTDARTLRWEELDSGPRTLSIQAGRETDQWGPVTTLTVHVPLPWYGRWQIWAGVFIAFVLVIFALWRARVQSILREERLRSRVAMDLHDEVGGELGALRLLMGLLGRDLPPDQRSEVSTRANRSLAAMTTSVRGIVWSMQPSHRDLQGLAAHLSERARTALPHLDQDLQIAVELPDTPVLLSLETVRGVRLIVREALHNIAKHSQATQVHLAVRCVGRGRWQVSLRDNGIGFVVSERSTSGAGLSSMHTRARAIGGALTLVSGSEGTTVDVTFRSI